MEVLIEAPHSTLCCFSWVVDIHVIGCRIETTRHCPGEPIAVEDSKAIHSLLKQGVVIDGEDLCPPMLGVTGGQLGKQGFVRCDVPCRLRLRHGRNQTGGSSQLQATATALWMSAMSRARASDPSASSSPRGGKPIKFPGSGHPRESTTACHAETCDRNPSKFDAMACLLSAEVNQRIECLRRRPARQQRRNHIKKPDPGIP